MYTVMGCWGLKKWFEPCCRTDQCVTLQVLHCVRKSDFICFLSYIFHIFFSFDDWWSLPSRPKTRVFSFLCTWVRNVIYCMYLLIWSTSGSFVEILWCCDEYRSGFEMKFWEFRLILIFNIVFVAKTRLPESLSLST